MNNLLTQSMWNWKASGIALALCFLLAVALVKPIGVSTQFVILDGIIWSWFDDSVTVADANSNTGYASSNAYLNKGDGKYAKSIANPMNYSFIFVIAMIVGGFIASRLQREKPSLQERITPTVWQQAYGTAVTKRYVVAFIGGFLVLFGARLAGGCTSGHMMSGMMQTSLSGYLFALGAFGLAIPVAMLFYKGGQ